MRQFEADDLKRFLVAVDDRLSDPFTLCIIGGSAALLAYGVQGVTEDIDTIDAEFRHILSAFEAARVVTGLWIPIECAAVYDAPYQFEDRLQAVDMPGLTKLKIEVPEKHDLVLMKTVRGQEPDLQTAEEIKRSRGLDLNTLIARYSEEMDHVVGHAPTIDLNFLALLGRLFGPEVQNRVKQQIDRRRRDDPEGTS